MFQWVLELRYLHIQYIKRISRFFPQFEWTPLNKTFVDPSNLWIDIDATRPNIKKIDSLKVIHISSKTLDKTLIMAWLHRKHLGNTNVRYINFLHSFLHKLHKVFKYFCNILIIKLHWRQWEVSFIFIKPYQIKVLASKLQGKYGNHATYNIIKHYYWSSQSKINVRKV